MKSCIRCGSYAINLKSNGRDESKTDLCDVCFWRTQTETANKTIAMLDEEIKKLKEENNYLSCLRSLHA